MLHLPPACVPLHRSIPFESPGKDGPASPVTASVGPSSVGCSAGSKPLRPRWCGPTSHRTLHTPSSPCANTPCFSFLLVAVARPVNPGRTRPVVATTGLGSLAWLPAVTGWKSYRIRKYQGKGQRRPCPRESRRIVSAPQRGVSSASSSTPESKGAKISSQRDFKREIARKS